MKKAFLSLIVALMMGLSLTFDHAPLFAQFSLSTPAIVTALPGAKVTIPLNLTNAAAKPISAFGLVFVYPATLLSFDTTLVTGTLTAGWIQASGRENASGKVTLGGFHTTPITASGVIINLVFKVKSAVTGCDTLKLRSFSDGLATASSKDGLICVVMQIGMARQAASGTLVAIEGIVTRTLGRFARLQDITAGMVAFESTGSFRTAVDSGRVRAGDRLRVTGVLAEFSQLKEITPISSFEVISRNNPLPKAPVSTLKDIAQNGEQYESQLIRLKRLRIDPAGDRVFGADKTYLIRDDMDNSNAVTLRLGRASDTRFVGRPIPIPPDAFDFEGVLTQFHASNPGQGYQLQPIDTTDLLLTTRVAEQLLLPPGQFALLANYPNPFNPTTSIRYDLPKEAHVRLAIYNLLGEKIRTLIDAKETAGFKRLTWDATNDAGVRVVSGVYLYRLEAGDVQITRKLVLMK